MSKLKELGVALRAYRVAAGESMEELAQATEIDIETIKKIETGTKQPEVETIELLAGHFSLREQEFNRLIKLAGIEKTGLDFDISKTEINLADLEKEVDVLISPVFYSDSINVVSNQFGVVINFVQSAGDGEKPVVISRVGMSHEHAKSVVDILQESLKRAGRKMDGDAGDSK